MMGQMVSAADYDGIEGFGVATPRQLVELRKALRSGSDRNAPSTVVPGDGFTLKPESLDKTLKNVTFSAEDIKAWKAWTKQPAYNTVEEYSRLRSYGSGIGAFMEEGELPGENDSTYSREVDFVKFMGVTRRVTHVMQTVRSHIGSVVAQETVNGTMDLLQQVETALFYGDSTLVGQEFDGLFTLIARFADSRNIIDKRGKPLSQDDIEEASHIIRAKPNFGKPTDLHLSDGAYSDLARLFYPTQRSVVPNAPVDGMVGFTVEGMRTQAGPIRFNPNVFILPGQLADAAGVGDVAKRPGAPTLSVPTTPPDAASLFLAADAGDYIYKVAARNRFGISTPTATAAVTVAAGDKATFTITDGSPLATCYIIYRTALNGVVGTASEITQIARTGAVTTFNDFNGNLPNCSKAALIQQNVKNLVIKQLAPFTRIPLAQIDTSMRWAQVLYLVLSLMSPNRNVLFKNVGRISGTLVPTI